MDTHSEEEKNRNMASLSSTNYSYMDQIHNTFTHTSQDMYNLATGMENMITFPPSKSHLPDHTSATWKDLFTSSGGASSSKAGFYHFNPGNTDDSMLPAPQDHNPYVDDSSLRCVFPCEGNERPSQGLSLSLSSTNPSAIGLQSFELRHPSDQGFFSKSTDHIQQSHHDQNMVLQEGYFGKSMNPAYPNEYFQIRASKYLGPAQDLLNEFCNLGNKESGHKGSKAKAREHESAIPSPSPGTFLELQKRKGKLLAMLEEVDRRYRHYCDQMRAVVSSFEAVAGNGAAMIYSEMASKAMSRHFRCLRDGIVSHIKATKKAMGEKDTSAPGMTRGETPRLRVLDQTLRQQRAFQQMSMMESHPWRPQRGLPERSVSVLRAWLFEHFLHPYPSDVDKHILARQTGLSRSQVSNWFINARVRLWKPMVEEMYLEETKEQDNILGSSDDNNIGRPRQNQNPHVHTEDQKPTLAQLGRIDSECLSSIIINPEKNDNERHQSHHHHQNQNQIHHHQGFGRVDEPFGAVELDFSSYGHHRGFGTVSGSGSGVSLTLGLQQHGENGVSLAFSSAPQGSLFYPRDHMEDCQTVQFSLLDGEAQNLPYRNLMGAQMLHDLAG